MGHALGWGVLNTRVGDIRYPKWRDGHPCRAADSAGSTPRVSIQLSNSADAGSARGTLRSPVRVEPNSAEIRQNRLPQLFKGTRRSGYA